MSQRLGFDHVTKVFPGNGKDADFVAFDDITLEAAPSEFLAIVGPSGCGKSTLLKIMNALIRPSTGSVALDGRALVSPSREIGIVFQQPVLLPWRNILDNVLLPAEIFGVDRNKARARALELLSLVGLAGFEQRYPGELSGGMQQRAAIARSLVYETNVLLMDEPFAALDAMTREDLNIELLRLWRVTGRTIIFITHNIPEAVLLSDRIVVMTPRPGKVREVIDIDLARPRSLSLMGEPRFGQFANRIRALLHDKPTPAEP